MENETSEMMEAEISISHLQFQKMKEDSQENEQISTIVSIYLRLKQYSVLRESSNFLSLGNARLISRQELNMDSLSCFVMKVWNGSIASDENEVSAYILK